MDINRRIINEKIFLQNLFSIISDIRLTFSRIEDESKSTWKEQFC